MQKSTREKKTHFERETEDGSLQYLKQQKNNAKFYNNTEDLIEKLPGILNDMEAHIDNLYQVSNNLQQQISTLAKQQPNNNSMDELWSRLNQTEVRLAGLESSFNSRVDILHDQLGNLTVAVAEQFKSLNETVFQLVTVMETFDARLSQLEKALNNTMGSLQEELDSVNETHVHTQTRLNELEAVIRNSDIVEKLTKLEGRFNSRYQLLLFLISNVQSFRNVLF